LDADSAAGLAGSASRPGKRSARQATAGRGPASRGSMFETFPVRVHDGSIVVELP
jgi:hypothetical protein